MEKRKTSPATGNDAVTAYNPVTNTWETLLATQTFTIGPQLGDGTYEVRGKSVLGNRDNQFGLIVPSRNEYWWDRDSLAAADRQLHGRIMARAFSLIGIRPAT
jgi:hypothetical protein